MSLRQVKEQVAQLRDEIGRHGGREWISVAVPAGMPDESVGAWLEQEIGQDWRRHVIIRLVRAGIAKPEVVERVPVAETAGIGGMVFAAEEAQLL